MTRLTTVIEMIKAGDPRVDRLLRRIQLNQLNDQERTARPCVRCNDLWLPTSFCFWNLCEPCFAEFDSQKMDGRFCQAETTAYEDATEWIRAYAIELLEMLHFIPTVSSIDGSLSMRCQNTGPMSTVSIQVGHDGTVNGVSIGKFIERESIDKIPSYMTWEKRLPKHRQKEA